jgi:hypothetical protein
MSEQPPDDVATSRPEDSDDSPATAGRTAGRLARRALFAGAAGLGAAGLITAVRPGRAQAADGDPVYQGDYNIAADTTTMDSTSGTGLYGITQVGYEAGVEGEDISSSDHSSGVVGFSQSGNGVSGQTEGLGPTGQAGVVGHDTSSGGGNFGVLGISTKGTGVQGTTQANGQSGASGIDTSSGGGHGTYGRSTNGTGAYGRTEANGQAGVVGVDSSTGGGYGVQGSSTAGTGVQAQSSSGTALSVLGVASFDRSGTAVVAGTAGSPQNSVTVDLVTLTKASTVLATAQAYLSGVTVAAAVPDPAASSFTIYLTQAVTTSFPVAWFILG